MTKVVVGTKYLGFDTALYCTSCGMLTAPATSPMQRTPDCDADEEYHTALAKWSPAGYVIRADDY